MRPVQRTLSITPQLERRLPSTCRSGARPALVTHTSQRALHLGQRHVGALSPTPRIIAPPEEHLLRRTMMREVGVLSALLPQANPVVLEQGCFKQSRAQATPQTN